MREAKRGRKGRLCMRRRKKEGGERGRRRRGGRRGESDQHPTPS